MLNYWCHLITWLLHPSLESELYLLTVSLALYFFIHKYIRGDGGGVEVLVVTTVMEVLGIGGGGAKQDTLTGARMVCAADAFVVSSRLELDSC